MHCVILGTKNQDSHGIEFRVTTTNVDHHELIGTKAVLNQDLARALFADAPVFRGEDAQRMALVHAETQYPEVKARDRIRIITFYGAVFPGN